MDKKRTTAQRGKAAYLLYAGMLIIGVIMMATGTITVTLTLGETGTVHTPTGYAAAAVGAVGMLMAGLSCMLAASSEE